MTSKNTLSAKNLEALGAERLAELLIEISTGNAAAKQRLRLESAGAQSPGEVAKEVRKRLITIARSRSFVDWQNRRTLIEDLETQRRAIVDQVAKADPAEALELIWRFMALANPVFGRCDDSSGTVIGVFHAACRDLGEIAQAAKLAPEALAERAFSALNENDYGQYDDLIGTLSPALGPTGLEQLKERFLELSKAPLEKPKDKDRRVIGWGVGGALYADEISSRQRETTIRLALQEIADAQGDVDAFIAQQSEAAKTVPRVAAEIARRLLDANRAKEAWKAINTVDENRPGWIPFEWEEVRLDVLEALGRKDEAQTFRWQCLSERSTAPIYELISNECLILMTLRRKSAQCRTLSISERASGFSISSVWPVLDKTAALVIRRSSELDGDHYEILSPAADALVAKYPLAATRCFVR